MKKADCFLIACMIVAAGAFALWTAIDKNNHIDSDQNQVVVTVDGEVYCTLSLAENQQVSIPTKDGESVLVIADHKCYMESANCSDQICVKHKKIQSAGESIICLPYKIVVTVKGAGENIYDN